MIEKFLRLFWGPRSPLSTLAGACLFFMATGRTGYALVTLGALVWTYTLSALVLGLASPILPRRGLPIIVPGILSALAALWLFLLFLFNPVLAWESSLYVILTPAVCHAQDLPRRIRSLEWKEALLQAFLESLVYGLPLLVLALVREFFGLGTITLPGREGALVGLFGPLAFFPVPLRILDASSGAFILFSYGIAAFRRFRPRQEDRP